MRFTMRGTAILIAGGMTLLACERSPTASTIEPRFAAAERPVEEALYDLTGTNFVFACDADGNPLPVTEGELVQIEGQLYERIMVVQNGKGEFHFTRHTMPVGLRGVGVDSGEEFRVTERDHAVSNQHGAGGTGMYRQELKLVGQDTNRTFSIVFSGSFMISKDGSASVTRDKERVVCRP